jgi:galactose-1-phosphate uridylyltransferase
MKKSQKNYFLLPDGTLKHLNPLTGTEVWTVPDRAHRPMQNRLLKPAKKLERSPKEDYCDFCVSNYFRTPPEKSRLILTSDGQTKKLDRVSPDLLETSSPLFRRVPNLFEIVTVDYWSMNHGFHLSPVQAQWKENYLGNPQGLEHVLGIIDTKLKLSGKTSEEIARLPTEEKLKLSDAFFGGAHEVVIARPHYQADAEFDNQLFSSGHLTPEEHFLYLKFTIDAIKDIHANNPFIRYVTIFQNWLQPSGASMDHLHKQMVGLDEWGSSIQMEMDVVRENPNIYNEAIIDFSAEHNLIFAENDHAVALSELGHRFPTLAIYSKSPHARPEEHTEEELRGFSDLVHACHAAMGGRIPCNEEWYYSPRDSKDVMPWHILIKWRTFNQAGFEGGTKIYINPISPESLRDQVVPKLYELRNEGKIKNLRIATECQIRSNMLLYHKK